MDLKICKQCLFFCDGKCIAKKEGQECPYIELGGKNKCLKIKIKK